MEITYWVDMHIRKAKHITLDIPEEFLVNGGVPLEGEAYRAYARYVKANLVAPEEEGLFQDISWVDHIDWKEDEGGFDEM